MMDDDEGFRDNPYEGWSHDELYAEAFKLLDTVDEILRNAKDKHETEVQKIKK